LEGGSDIDIVAKMKAAIEKSKDESLDNESDRLRKEMKDLMS